MDMSLQPHLQVYEGIWRKRSNELDIMVIVNYKLPNDLSPRSFLRANLARDYCCLASQTTRNFCV